MLDSAQRASAGAGAAFFVRNATQRTALEAAATGVADKALKVMLPNGIAWHNAAMEQSDRTIVEQLFISRDVMFLAATGTLAQARILLCVLAASVRAKAGRFLTAM